MQDKLQSLVLRLWTEAKLYLIKYPTNSGFWTTLFHNNQKAADQICWLCRKAATEAKQSDADPEVILKDTILSAYFIVKDLKPGTFRTAIGDMIMGYCNHTIIEARLKNSPRTSAIYASSQLGEPLDNVARIGYFYQTIIEQNGSASEYLNPEHIPLAEWVRDDYILERENVCDDSTSIPTNGMG